MPTDDTILDFPCSFPIKAMGKTAHDFDALVVSLIRQYYPDITEGMNNENFYRSHSFST